MRSASATISSSAAFSVGDHLWLPGHQGPRAVPMCLDARGRVRCRWTGTLRGRVRCRQTGTPGAVWQCRQTGTLGAAWQCRWTGTQMTDQDEPFPCMRNAVHCFQGRDARCGLLLQRQRHQASWFAASKAEMPGLVAASTLPLQRCTTRGKLGLHVGPMRGHEGNQVHALNACMDMEHGSGHGACIAACTT